MEFRETVHPFDQDAYDIRWDHDGHEHFVVTPREQLTDQAWLKRHAERVNAACARMWNQAGGDGRG